VYRRWQNCGGTLRYAKEERKDSGSGCFLQQGISVTIRSKQCKIAGETDNGREDKRGQ